MKIKYHIMSSLQLIIKNHFEMDLTKNTYILLEFAGYTKYIVFWLLTSSLLTIINVCLYLYKNSFDFRLNDTKLHSKKENPVLEEMPGLPFILLHSLCFGVSLYTSNVFASQILFLYWGPLYIVTALLVLAKVKINWKTIAIPSSIMCKSFYVIFVGLFGYLKCSLPIYCYSLWIMNDQVNLAWFKNNGDRTRRFFEDYFIFRIGYPLFLFLPIIDQNFYYRDICVIVSSLLLFFWLVGIMRLYNKGIFFVKPKIEGFGRDIVYS